MTNKKAAELIKSITDYCEELSVLDGYADIEIDEELYQALKLAIKALEKGE